MPELRTQGVVISAALQTLTPEQILELDAALGVPLTLDALLVGDAVEGDTVIRTPGGDWEPAEIIAEEPILDADQISETLAYFTGVDATNWPDDSEGWIGQALAITSGVKEGNKAIIALDTLSGRMATRVKNGTWGGWNFTEGENTPNLYKENVEPGVTDMTAAVQAALLYGDVELLDEEYYCPSTAQNILTIPAEGRVIRGKGTISGSGSNATGCFLFNQAGPLELYDCTIQVLATGQDNAQLIKTTGNLKLRNVILDGQTVYTTGTPNQNSYGISIPETGTQDNIDVQNCEFTRMTWPVLKTNTATSTQDNFRFTNNDFHGNFREDIGINSPLGTITNASVSFNRFRDHAGTAAGISASRLYISVSGVVGGVVLGNEFTGTIQDCVHIEYSCKNLTVTANVSKCAHENNGSFCSIAPNDIAADLAPSNVVVQGNTAINTSASTVSVGVWLYNNAYTGAPRQSGIVISNNILDGFIYGVILDNETDGRVKITGNIARNATYGFHCVAGVDIFDGNTSDTCTNGVRSTFGTTFSNHTFIGCTTTVNAAGSTGALTHLVDPKFIYPAFSVGAGTSVYNTLIPHHANTRYAGQAIVSARCENASDHSTTYWLVNFDGTTFAVPSAVVTAYQPGVINTAFKGDTGVFRVQCFCSAARTSVELSVIFKGLMAVQS